MSWDETFSGWGLKAIEGYFMSEAAKNQQPQMEYRIMPIEQQSSNVPWVPLAIGAAAIVLLVVLLED